MAERPNLRAKLAGALLELPAKTRTVLVRHIDKARMIGEGDPTYDLILDAAQMAFRMEGGQAPRLHSPMRRLFIPVEPFLVDVVSPVKQAGRIARSSLNPIWAWLTRDLLVNELPPLIEAIKQAALADDEARADQLGETLVNLVEQALTGLPQLLAEPSTRRRIAAQIGSDRVLHDLLDFGRVLPLRAELAELGQRLPMGIGAYDQESIGAHLAVIEAFAKGGPERMTYGLALLQGQLDDPAKIVMHACAGARSDQPARVLESRFAPAVGLALGAIEESIVRLRRTLEAGADLAEAPAALRTYHAMTRTLTTVIDVGSVPEWRGRLATLRRETSELIAPPMTEALALNRRVIHPAGGRGGGLTRPDAIEAQRATSIAALVMAARGAADSLALNALLAELKTTLEPALEAAIAALVDRVRSAKPDEREAGQERSTAALLIARTLFGEQYAVALQRKLATAQGATQKAAS